ncbi:glycosyltransferase family 4 protein [Bacillus taeanensis]|uniref:Undecaprenyl/decaprenyl-phosphate alpha-N-acetylglucosaminyl 1-phosphate transferase n=1 Tax=Bacillus taeanensis TaxID=273032 RepID=A0A366XPD2_9BACI|nr:MraY family glycosyltransferase [Bacillus taeanensis]RBW67596.1 undecaprenyl/decaprenyl-phosphate alpha-N-acetylglucosaminyl 1-phosphate transferase [Bacillus taeanensis]
MEYVTLLLCFISAVLLTPIVKKLAFKIGATDKPDPRKVHQKIMPRLGGLAIYISTLIGFAVLQPESPYLIPILIGSFIIIVTGVADDILQLSPKVKLFGQVLAAAVVIYGGVEVQFINLPFNTQLNLGIFGIPLTMLWIIGITNAINLIDGLDGLAAGVSSIVLMTVSVMAIINGNEFVFAMGCILLGSTLGFLIFNFHPAKIFMGDTGALFLGFMISVTSLLGFKNITLFSLVVPVIMLGVPISDTFFAIIRRFVNKKPLSAPDKSHLHHCLLRLGFSHQKTVLIIYAMSAIFGAAAMLFSMTTLWGSVFIITVLLFLIELTVEMIGLVDANYRPMLKFIRRISNVKKAS